MGAAKRWSTLLLLSAVGLLTAWALQEHHARTADEAAWQLATQGQVQLTASTAAKLAATQVERDSLAALVRAAHQLGGTLISGTRFTVVAHDTTIVHDTIPTVVTRDSTRIAEFRDSTFAGVVSGQVTAPPCCAPLHLTLSVARPAFHPQVGFVQLGAHVAAVVDWQGEHVRIDNAFALPVVHPNRVVPWVEATYALLGNTTVRAGVDLRVLGIRVGPTLSVGNGPQLGITVRKEF